MLATSPYIESKLAETTFPPFSLTRLLKTVFVPLENQRIAILIDLKDPQQVKDFAFLQEEGDTVQKYAYNVFYKGLQDGGLAELNCTGGDLFAYQETGGSNLDMPDEAYAPDGSQLSLEKDVYAKYDLILCVSTFSATAPLTAHAKKHGFRGATLHGLNETILNTGLAVDYNEVSANAEKLRLAMTKADWAEIDFVFDGEKYTLHLELEGQEAQKSHGLCHGMEPDVANLPAGEVYFVPRGGHGSFPFKYEDGSIGLLDVEDGKITLASLLSGSPNQISAHNRKLEDDPMTGVLGELGLGTQALPFSGRDIQDEKVIGTVHVATGRDDHLGGHVTPDQFKKHENASHDDVLYAPHKTPEIEVPEVRFSRGGEIVVTHRNYQPSEYLLKALGEA